MRSSPESPTRVAKKSGVGRSQWPQSPSGDCNRAPLKLWASTRLSTMASQWPQSPSGDCNAGVSRRHEPLQELIRRNTLDPLRSQRRPRVKPLATRIAVVAGAVQSTLSFSQRQGRTRLRLSRRGRVAVRGYSVSPLADSLRQSRRVGWFRVRAGRPYEPGWGAGADDRGRGAPCVRVLVRWPLSAQCRVFHRVALLVPGCVVSLWRGEVSPRPRHRRRHPAMLADPADWTGQALPDPKGRTCDPYRIASLAPFCIGMVCFT